MLLTLEFVAVWQPHSVSRRETHIVRPTLLFGFFFYGLSILSDSEYHIGMPPQETPPIDIPPPPEAERLAALKARRDELEQQLSDEKAKLRRMQADRRALLHQQIKRSKSRLSTAERKRRTQRLILLGRLREHQMETQPGVKAAVLAELDVFLTRNDHRALWGLPPLDKPSKPTAAPSASTGSRDDSIPGWHPYRIPGTKKWLAEFEGDPSALPDELVGLHIIVTAKNSEKSWMATVLEIIEHTESRVLVRT